VCPPSLTAASQVGYSSRRRLGGHLLPQSAASYHGGPVDWQTVTDGLATAFQVAPKAYELGTKPRATERNYENPKSPGLDQNRRTPEHKTAGPNCAYL